MKKIRFKNCQIDISKKVFVPRIETEFWVKKAIKEIKKQGTGNNKQVILDIFAGSGCIGIAILKNVKNSFVDFVDIDEEVIKQIKINLKLNRIEKEKYEIYKSNLFEKFRGKDYDFIFANPPYIARDRINEVEKEVLETEPPISLFAGRDGMFYIEKFFSQVKKYLKPNGKIFLEFDPFQKEQIKEILKREGFKFIFKKDQFEKYRWLKASI